MLGNKIVYLAGIITVIACLFIFYARKQAKKRKIVKKQQELLDNTDELTQINNRQYVDSMLEKEFQRSARYEECLSYVIMEIDHFQELRNEYGRQFTRKILKDTAENLQERVRAYDVLARDKHWFLCILPETDMEGALLVTKRARAIIAAENHYFRIDGEPIHVTACIGITTYRPHINKNITADDMKDAAQKALDTARGKGPNNIEFTLL